MYNPAMAIVCWFALGLGLQDVDGWIERLISGTLSEQEEAAAELVKLGAKARTAALAAHRKETRAEVRARIEAVVLRIDAGTDEESGEAGPAKVTLAAPTFETELSKEAGDKKMLHLQVPLTAENWTERAEELILKKATFHTFQKKTDLLVIAKGNRKFGWTLAPEHAKQTIYHNLITPQWKKGALALVVMEFECGGKTVKLRTPVGEIIDE